MQLIHNTPITSLFSDDSAERSPECMLVRFCQPSFAFVWNDGALCVWRASSNKLPKRARAYVRLLNRNIIIFHVSCNHQQHDDPHRALSLSVSRSVRKQFSYNNVYRTMPLHPSVRLTQNVLPQRKQRCVLFDIALFVWHLVATTCQ